MRWHALVLSTGYNMSDVHQTWERNKGYHVERQVLIWNYDRLSRVETMQVNGFYVWNEI